MNGMNFKIFREILTEDFKDSVFLCTFAAVIKLKID